MVQASRVESKAVEEPAGEASDKEPATLSVARAANGSAEIAPAAGGGARKRMNKEERLCEKAAAVAEASKGRRSRCGALFTCSIDVALRP